MSNIRIQKSQCHPIYTTIVVGCDYKSINLKKLAVLRENKRNTSITNSHSSPVVRTSYTIYWYCSNNKISAAQQGFFRIFCPFSRYFHYDEWTGHEQQPVVPDATSSVSWFQLGTHISGG
jgi:hypothetical protein